MEIPPPRLVIPASESKVIGSRLLITQSCAATDIGFDYKIQDDYEPAEYFHPLGSYAAWRFRQRIKTYSRPHHKDGDDICKICRATKDLPVPYPEILIKAEDIPEPETIEGKR